VEKRKLGGERAKGRGVVTRTPEGEGVGLEKWGGNSWHKNFPKSTTSRSTRKLITGR